MNETSSTKAARRHRVEAQIRALAGSALGDILWSGDGRAIVLGPDGEPFLQVEATDSRAQQGIRVVPLGLGRQPERRPREGQEAPPPPSPPR